MARVASQRFVFTKKCCFQFVLSFYHFSIFFRYRFPDTLFSIIFRFLVPFSEPKGSHWRPSRLHFRPEWRPLGGDGFRRELFRSRSEHPLALKTLRGQIFRLLGSIFRLLGLIFQGFWTDYSIIWVGFSLSFIVFLRCFFLLFAFSSYFSFFFF